MKKIANIISSKDEVEKKCDWINYYEILDDNTEVEKFINSPMLVLPTLVVGWTKFKTKFTKFKPDINNHEHGMLSWIFSKDEKMTFFFNGLDEFVKIAPKKFIDSFGYKVIDPIVNKIQNEEQLIEQLPEFKTSHAYQYKDEIIYLYYKERKEIIGIYLPPFKYFNMDTAKISQLIQQNCGSMVIDKDGTQYQQFYKQFPDFDRLKRTMVIFL